MRLFDEIDEILRNSEVAQFPRDKAESLEIVVLTDLSRRYRRLVEERDWQKADECLLVISKLLAVILAA